RHRGVRGAQVFDSQIALGGKRMRRIVVLVAVLALVAGVSSDAIAEAPIKIRFAWQPYNAVLFYTARDLKLFEKAGLDAELVKFTAGPPQFAAYRTETIH